MASNNASRRRRWDWVKRASRRLRARKDPEFLAMGWSRGFIPPVNHRVSLERPRLDFRRARLTSHIPCTRIPAHEWYVALTKPSKRAHVNVIHHRLLSETGRNWR